MYRDVHIFDISEDEREEELQSDGEMIDLRELCTGSQSLLGSKREYSHRRSRRSQAGRDWPLVEEHFEADDDRYSDVCVANMRVTREGGLFFPIPPNAPAKRLAASAFKKKDQRGLSHAFKKSLPKTRPLPACLFEDAPTFPEHSGEESNSSTPRIVTLSLATPAEDLPPAESARLKECTNALENKLASLESLECHILSLIGCQSPLQRQGLEGILVTVLKEKEKIVRLIRWGGSDMILEEAESELESARDGGAFIRKVEEIKLVIGKVLQSKPGHLRKKSQGSERQSCEEQPVSPADFDRRIGEVKTEIDLRLKRLNEQLDVFSGKYRQLELQARRSVERKEDLNKLGSALSNYTTDTFHESSVGTLHSHALGRILSPLRTPINSTTPKQLNTKMQFFQKVMKRDPKSLHPKPEPRSPPNILKDVMGLNVLRPQPPAPKASTTPKASITSLEKM